MKAPGHTVTEAGTDAMGETYAVIPETTGHAMLETVTSKVG